MPELPEVETIARGLGPALIGRRILSARVRWRGTIAFPTVEQFRRHVATQEIRDVGRRGKFLRIRLSSYDLLFHLRMSGDVEIRPASAPLKRHDRLILKLGPRSNAISRRGSAGGKAAADQAFSNLVFNDTRKFGRVWLTDNVDDVIGALGPEPLSRSFTGAWLYGALHARRRLLKPLLLDQTFLAGLGNIYTDEALHMAKLHPLTASNSVSRVQAARLCSAIRATLREGIRRNGASIDWVYRGGEFQNHFRVYGRTGEPCPVCGTAIVRLVVGQRGTHICPSCQRG